MRSRLLVRVDGAGASHELITCLLSLASRRRTVLFSCGRGITEADEQAIGLLPAAAWQAGLDQDGAVQEDKHVAEDLKDAEPDTLRYLLRTNASALADNAHPQVKGHLMVTSPFLAGDDKQQRGEGRRVV
jgi:hypothetical protein